MLPEIRIVLYMIFVVSLFFISNLVVYLCILVGIALFLFLVPFSNLKRGWIPLSLFLLFTFMSTVLFQPGRILYASGPFLITEEGLKLASVRTLRLFLMVYGAKILTATTEIQLLISAMANLLKPLGRLGVPVNEFFSLMNLTMKSLPVLKEEIINNYREKVQTEKVTGILNRAKLVAVFLVPFFVKSLSSPETIFDGDRKKNEKG